MAKKKKLRVDRVIIAAVVSLFLVFILYKGVSFVVTSIMNFFEKDEVKAIDNEEKTYLGTVVLDPGHGGIDAGSKKGTLYEKNISLQTAKAIGKALEAQNIKVIYTRTTDTALHEDKITDLKMRAAFSQEHKANYFVSIHVNDFDKSNNVSGFEVYTKDEKSRELATSIGTYIEKLNYSKNRGIQDGSTLMVLKENTVSSVLVELGYINGKDYEYLNNEEKLEKMGNAISQGIMALIQKE